MGGEGFDLWHTANPDQQESGTLDPPADGTYVVALIDAGAFTSSAAETWVKTLFKDELADYEWTVLHGFRSQAQANVTKKTCRQLGVPIDTVVGIEQLDDEMKKLIGKYYSVTVKSTGKFRNTYINGPAESAAVGDSAAAGSDVPW